MHEMFNEQAQTESQALSAWSTPHLQRLNRKGTESAPAPHFDPTEYFFYSSGLVTDTQNGNNGHWHGPS